MFRNEFLQVVWKKGWVDVQELARLLNTTEDLIEAEAGVCAAHGWIRMLDSLIVATPASFFYFHDAIYFDTPHG